MTLLPFLSILFLSLFSLSSSKLFIKAPNDMFIEDRFDQIDGLAHVVLTPQTKITYKHRFTGNLIINRPNEDACSDVASIPTDGNNTAFNPVLVAPWGKCHYLQKVRNAELAGAKMLVLVLGDGMGLDHPSIQQLPMKTNIEVVVILKGDGDELIEVLREGLYMGKNDFISLVQLQYYFDPTRNVNYKKTEGSVVLDYWMTPTDVSKISYEFLEDLGNVLEKFGEALEFNPHYVLWENEALVKSGNKTGDKRCVSNGRYCDPEAKIENRLYGSEAVLEALRQICFRDLDDKTNTKGLWWKYMSVWADQCVDTSLNLNAECHETVFETAKIPGGIVYKVQKCMRESFGAEGREDLKTVLKENLKLKAELSEQKKMHVDHYPALYVNNERYTGNLRNGVQLMEFICSHYKHSHNKNTTIPEICIPRKVDVNELVYSSTDMAIYLGIFLGSVVIMSIILVCVRTSVKKEIMAQMNGEVEQRMAKSQKMKAKDPKRRFSSDADATTADDSDELELQGLAKGKCWEENSCGEKDYEKGPLRRR